MLLPFPFLASELTVKHMQDRVPFSVVKTDNSCRCDAASLRSSTGFFFLGGGLTFFDELHKHGVVAADGEPEAIFIFLDDYASRDQTCVSETRRRQERHNSVFKRSRRVTAIKK